MAKEAERISDRISQFRYFNKQLGRPDWTGKKVLDFGGNIGGFLSGAHAQRKIDSRLYWCLDVYRPALAQGHRRRDRECGADRRQGRGGKEFGGELGAHGVR